MYIFKRNKKQITAFIFLILITITLTSCFVPHLVLSEIINRDGLIKIILNKSYGSEVYTFDGKAGDVFQIQSEVRTGHLKLEIVDPKGVAIYQGNFQQISKFNIRLSNSGKYTIVVKSQWCDGVIYINKIEGGKRI